MITEKKPEVLEILFNMSAETAVAIQDQLKTNQ